MSNELERIIVENEDLPAHILGLNGWFLRVLPKEARNGFLRDFLKIVQVAYHPDRVQEPKEKQRREKYIHAVANAVSFLTKNQYAFDIAVEEVPTTKNPTVALKMQLDAYLAEIRKLEGEITGRDSRYSALEIIEGELRKDLANCENKVEELKKHAIFEDILNYQTWQMRNTYCVPINSNSSILLNVQKMAMKKTVTSQRTGKTIKQISLREILRKAKGSFSDIDESFKKQVELGLLRPGQETLYFVGGKGHRRREDNLLPERTTILGSLPIMALKCYFDLKTGQVIPDMPAGFSGFSYLDSPFYKGKKGSFSDKEFRDQIKPFLTPYVASHVPALVRYEGKEHVRHSLVYVKDVQEFPSGGELDLWFGVLPEKKI